MAKIDLNSNILRSGDVIASKQPLQPASGQLIDNQIEKHFI